MKKLILFFCFLLLLTGNVWAQRSVLTEKQKDSIRVMIGDSTAFLRSLIISGGTDSATVSSLISDSLGLRDSQIDSIFSLISDVAGAEVDSITITMTSTEPPKLQISVTWLDGRVDSLVTNIDSTKIRAVTIATDGTLIIANSTDPPAEITYIGSVGGEGGIRVVETVQVSGNSPTFGIHKNGNVSDINPPASMTSGWDWALPDKSGTFAMTNDIALFIDTLYRSNDTIYFKQKDGTTLYFVDTNTDVEGDTTIGTYQTLDSLITDYWNGTLGGLPDTTGVAFGSPLKYTPDGIEWATDLQGSGDDPDVPYLWALAQPDTVGSVASIDSVAGADTSTLYTSDKFPVSGLDSVYGVGRVAVDSGQYSVRYWLRGTWTWSDWSSSQAYYRGIDSAQVRFYTGAAEGSTYRQRFYVSSDVDTFMVSTASGGDTLGTNLFNNSDFETALNWETDWDATGTATVIRSDEQAYAGTYSGKVTSSTSGGGIRYVNEGNYVAVEVGETYWVEGYYYLVSGGSTIRAEYATDGVNLTDTDDWTYFKFSFEAGLAWAVVDVKLLSSTATTFYVDNLTIKKRL